MKYFLIIISCVLAFPGLLKDYLPQKYKTIKVMLPLCLCLLMSAGIQIYLEHRHNKTEWQSKWSGHFQSPVKSHQTNPFLKLGGTRLRWDGEPNKPIIDIYGEPLTINLVDGRAELSLVIRDKNGIILAAIRNNEWFVAPPPVTLDRNFDDNSLEVIDSKGEVIFQVQVYGEEIRLAGNFYSISGMGPFFLGPLLTQSGNGKLFKYPSSEHHGELEVQ